MNKFVCIVFVSIILLYACQHESLIIKNETLKGIIEATATSKSIDEYLLPDGKDLAKILAMSRLRDYNKKWLIREVRTFQLHPPG